MTEEELKSLKKYSLMDSPIEITGLPWVYEKKCYDRVPLEYIPEEYTDLFKYLIRNTSGGIARVKTNADAVYFKARVGTVIDYMYHMSRVARSGFDFHVKYEGEPLRFIHPSVPIDDGKTTYELPLAVRYNGLYDGSGSNVKRQGKMYELWIVFPTYNTLEEADIYVDKDAVVLPPEPLKYDKPVVFYGSSITHGACASRPSLGYANRIALDLCTPIINFGISGHAMGEDWMARLIADREMSAFVMDYDHNAPDIKHLASTHERFYKVFREKQPDTPVIFVTKPDYRMTLDDNDKRRRIIRKTYLNAKKRGENVYFVDGKKFFEGMRNICLVDGCHPNDIGFDRMTRAIEPVVRKILEK